MNWIQALLIVSVLALLLYLLRARGTAQAKAWVKVGFALFVVRRGVRDPAARRHHRRGELAGCGPGTDLMAYALIIAFVFTTLSAYMRFKDLESRYTRVALRGRAAECPDARGALGGPEVGDRPGDAVFELHVRPQPKTCSARPKSRLDRLRSPSRGGWNSGSSGAPTAAATTA